VSKAEIIEFLRGKCMDALADAIAREQSEQTWRGGNDESWKLVASLHPSTAANAMNKKARLKEAEIHQRIAAKLRREAEMFKAAFNLLEDKP
jgi:hypothetical protein